MICCGGGAEMLATTQFVGVVLGPCGLEKIEGSGAGGTGAGGGEAGTEGARA